jgi:hypothetical protein
MSLNEHNMENTCRNIADVLTKGVFEKLSTMAENERDAFFSEKTDFSDLGFDNKAVMLFNTLNDFDKSLINNTTSIEIDDADFNELFNQNHDIDLVKKAQEGLTNLKLDNFK